MSCCCSTFGAAVVRQFDARVAESDLRRYHNDFRAFAHPARAMEQVIERHGFRRASRAATFVWVVDVFTRATP